jgi:two-component system, cell cycle response regulator CtrA
VRIFQLGVDSTTVAFLESNGFSVHTEDIDDAEELHDWIVDGGYEAVIIDLDRSNLGIFAVRYLRSREILVSVIGLAGPDENHSWSEQRSLFLEQGGDDLLRMPPNPRELAAVLRASTRRGKGLLLDIREIRNGDAVVRVNLSTQTVTVNGEYVHLTGKELLVLSLLASSGRTQTKEALLNNLYTSVEDEAEIKIVDVFVCKIRKKLDAVYPGASKVIGTVWGRGYQIVSSAEQKLAS